MIVPEAEFVKVGLEIMASDVVVHTPQAIFYQRPESLNRIRMYVANDVDAFAMVDSAVGVASCSESVVGAVIIGEHGGPWKDVLFDKAAQRIGFRVTGDEGADLALALNHANNSGLGPSSPWCKSRFVGKNI